MWIDINKYISYEIPLVKSSEDISIILDMMYDFGVDYIGVQNDEGNFKGLISLSQVEELQEEGKNLLEVIEDLPLYLGQDKMHIYEVLTLMSKYQISLLPIFDGEANYLGCITGKGLAHKLLGSLSAVNEGSLVVIKLNDRDYSLTEIARIIENNDVKIYALFTEETHESGAILLSLVLNRAIIDPLLRSLRRFSYDIIYTVHKGALDDEMNDRWEEIHRILNV